MAKTVFLVSFTVLFFSSLVICSEGEEDPDIPVVEGHGGDLKITTEGDVIVLTSENFHLITASRELLLVEFYAPWCGHCKRLEPEYSKAASELKNNNPPIEIAKFDATTDEKLAQKYEVTGFPTLLLLKRGEVLETYEEDRSSMAIVQFMKKRSDPNYKPPPKRVLELTSENFDDNIRDSNLILVEFYADNCPTCKQLAGRYELAAQDLYNHQIPLAKIDGGKYKEIANKYGAQQWPVFKIFRQGRVYDYEGPHDTEGMVPFMIDESKLPSTEVKNIQQLKNNLSNDTVSVVGFFEDDTVPFYQEYISAAYSSKKFFKYTHTFDSKVAKHFKESMNSIVLFKPAIFQSQYEDSSYRLTDVDSKDSAITFFIEANKYPLVGYRTKKNLEFYNTHPICVIFGDVNFNHEYRTASQIIRKQILKVAKDYKDITFVLSNDDEFQDEIYSLGLIDSSEEINAALFLSQTKRYVLEPSEEFDGDVLRSFLDDALAGKIKPLMKSQPVPKKNSGPVKKVVANNFEDVVLENPDSVLLEFYAPWCGHCKSLDPIYKQLGKKYAKMEGITIAQMDATANDIDERFKVTGFPTIYLLKASDKSTPISFEGPRTLDGMSEFIDSNLDTKNKDEL